MTDGLDILARTLQQPRPPRRDPGGTRWQYHPRRGFHSEVTCWGVMFDLLQTSALLRQHCADGKVVFGLDVPMRDYVRNKSKKLDLVVGRPNSNERRRRRLTFADLVNTWELELSAAQHARLDALPAVEARPIGQVHLTVEAKAAMTEFGKARPRLFDELNSSHQIVHGASNKALAVGLAMINVADRFYSPLRNPGMSYDSATQVNRHKQPQDAELTVGHVMTLPRRGGTQGTGYDALAIVVVRMANDGGSVEIVTDPPAPPPDSVFAYRQTIRRVASEYDTTFARI